MSAHEIPLASDRDGALELPGRGHGRSRRPCVGRGVVLLVLSQITSVGSARKIRLASDHDGGRIASGRGHGRPRAPGVGRGVVLFILRPIGSVRSAHDIRLACYRDGGQTISSGRHGRSRAPGVGRGVVLLVLSQIASVSSAHDIRFAAYHGGGQCIPGRRHRGPSGPIVARAPSGVAPIPGHVDRRLPDVAVGEGRARRVGRGGDGEGRDLVEIDAGGHGGVERRAQDEEEVVRRTQRVIGLHTEVVGRVVRHVGERRVGIGGLRGTQNRGEGRHGRGL